MATITQVQKGFALFVDNEIASAFTGWQRAVVGGLGGLLASNLNNIVKTYGTHPFVAALGLYDPESNTVNIEAAYNAIAPKMTGEKIPITIPKLGTIKIGKDEIDALVRYIKEVSRENY